MRSSRSTTLRYFWPRNHHRSKVMSDVTVSMKLSPKAAGALFSKACRLEDENKELRQKLERAEARVAELASQGVLEGFVLAERHLTPDYVVEAGTECYRALEKAGCSDTRTIVQTIFQDMLLAIE